MPRIKQLAFTLIELLVVIAIIGILSGLIVVSMNGVTQKATIAKSQIFSNSLRNSLMLNLVSELKLDGNANDAWSGGNNGTLNGFLDTTAGYGDTHTSGWMSDSNCVSGTCLKFDGANNFINFNNNSNLHFSNNFTIEAWVNIPSAPTSVDGMILGDYNGAYKGYQFYISTNRTVYMQIGRQSDSTAAGVASNQQVDINKWNHVAISYDGRANTFVNGQRTRSGVDYSPIEAETANIMMGKAQWYARYFLGSIDNVRAYNAAVSTSLIKEHYYVGLNNLLSKGEITREDYQNRIEELAISL